EFFGQTDTNGNTRPSGLTNSDRLPDPSRLLNVRNSLPVSASQRRSVRSLPPETSVRLSKSKATCSVLLSCPFRRAISFPLTRSHTWMISPQPHASSRLSAEKAAKGSHVKGSLFSAASIFASGLPEGRSHSRSAQSGHSDTSVPPSGANATRAYGGC